MSFKKFSSNLGSQKKPPANDSTGPTGPHDQPPKPDVAPPAVWANPNKT